MAVPVRHSEAVEVYLQTLQPPTSLPWREASFAVLGLETTGPDAHRDEIVRVACVPVEGGRAIIGKALEATVGPGKTQGRLIEVVIEALTGRVLVAHAVSQQAGFLSATFATQGIRLKAPMLDTAALTAWVAPHAAAEGGWPRPSADISRGLLRAASGIGLPVHRPHEASGAALTTAQLFMALACHLDHVHPQSVGSLARLCSKPRGLQLGRYSVRL
jgi:DNA polymerase-3 subunit epsilon